MTKIIDIQGTFEGGSLYGELVAAIPELGPVDGHATLLLDVYDDHATLYVPDDIDESAVDAVAAAHDGAAQIAAAALAAARAAKTTEIKAALADTSVWIERAFEEGIDLPAPRKAHREALRERLLQVNALTDPAAIEIPTAPSWVPAS